jgi:hypothetical protein
MLFVVEWLWMWERQADADDGDRAYLHHIRAWSRTHWEGLGLEEVEVGELFGEALEMLLESRDVVTNEGS